MPTRDCVDVEWSPVAACADDVIRTRISALRGPQAAEIGRLCPRCASSDHGAPWARYDGQRVGVSLARSGPHLVTVVEVTGASIGVDVESVEAISALSPADLLASGESAGTALEAAQLWAAKEALLKASGTGLIRPMNQVRIRDYVGILTQLDAPDGYVAVLASGVRELR